ncbi:hypothetical protein JDV02_009223 [Purpureocillium takamizusanense]|uniref:Uncharacterized protein n=1 Tax=Purpureocillium takamizusanense TaxID=2060973 RepID=A0A9Q8QR85_9HYPO|nr:uncharacterized protein JDV02_009223 [Purpureocillium takamizusanense]UNI23401.1 hypothetical protein JDV02_009223 [Purpureocillium takamizusanense]
MPPALDIDGRDLMSLLSVLDEEKKNINHLAPYWPATKSLYRHLWEQRRSIAGLVKHHLALGIQDTCIVLPPERWIRGSFNVCVLVDVRPGHASSSGRVIVRGPMPYKLAEARYSGSVN